MRFPEDCGSDRTVRIEENIQDKTTRLDQPHRSAGAATMRTTASVLVTRRLALLKRTALVMKKGASCGVSHPGRAFFLCFVSGISWAE